jgi:hypothetical protein
MKATNIRLEQRKSRDMREIFRGLKLEGGWNLKIFEGNFCGETREKAFL